MLAVETLLLAPVPVLVRVLVHLAMLTMLPRPLQLRFLHLPLFRPLLVPPTLPFAGICPRWSSMYESPRARLAAPFPLASQRNDALRDTNSLADAPHVY